MTDKLNLESTNTILYCHRWPETVDFYRHRLKLPITFSSDWFVEFQLTATAHLSIADAHRATIKTGNGAGLTLAFQVENADHIWQYLHDRGLALGPLKDHPWGARVFYFFDPEGHRLEIWSPIRSGE